MADDEALIRCRACKTVNKVPVSRFEESPHCGKCKGVLEIPAKPVDVTVMNFDEEVNLWPGLVLLDFWAQWCGACRMVAPILEDLAKRARGFVKVVKIDVDVAQELGRRFGIKATPTLVLYRNGKKINEIAGALTSEQIDEWLAASVRA
ncbi:MAG: thioredoxin [Nitrospirae bacterium]|nr:thioredoxin [Nitrospirota bacterium]